tara:strand:+ start:231 stop:335 length:105 start_codon:yes stop_codon:yes gene_type:complete
MPAPPTIATVMFIAGAVIPFSVIVICAVIGLIKR